MSDASDMRFISRREGRPGETCSVNASLTRFGQLEASRSGETDTGLDHGADSPSPVAISGGAFAFGALLFGRACYRLRRRCHAPGSLAAVGPSGACDPEGALLGRDGLRLRSNHPGPDRVSPGPSTWGSSQMFNSGRL